MVLSKCDAVRDLHCGRSDWKIRIRVISKWGGKPLSATEPGGIHFIFIDDGNTRIHAFIGPGIIKDFPTNLVEGNVYEITNFTVNNGNESLGANVVRNGLHIYFEANSFAVEIENDDILIPKTHLDIYPFDVVEQLATEKNYCVDLIGIMENILPVHRFTNKNTGLPQCWVILFLSNGRATLKLKLWDEICEQFGTKMKSESDVAPVISFSSCKPTIWQGELTVSSTSATRFIVNGDEPVFHMFRDTLGERSISSKTDVSHKVKAESTVLQNIKCVKTHALEKHFKDNPNEQVTCNLTVENLNVNKKWLMLVCTRCQEHISKDGQSYFCVHCNKKIPIPDKRYLLYVTAIDETGEVNLVCRNREVHSMSGKAVYDLDCLDEYEDDDIENENVIIPQPPEIKNMHRKTFEFTLSRTEENLPHIYVVSAVCPPSQSASTGNGAEELTVQSQKPMDQSLTGGNEVSPLEGKKSTPHTGASTNKRKLKKKQDAVPFEMDEHVPLTQLKVPKKERGVSVPKTWMTPYVDYKYADDTNIPLLTVFRLSNLLPHHIEPEKMVKSYGHIVQVDEEERWYENTCSNCNSQTEYVGGFYKCESCHTNCETPTRRFRVIVYVEDSEYTVGLILPHNIVIKLCPNLDTELLKESVIRSGHFPAALKKMEGVKQLWVVMTKTPNLQGLDFLWTCCASEDTS